MVALEARDERLEPGIIGHDVAAVRIPQRHADVLPHLYAHGTVRQGVVDLLQRRGSPVRRVEALDGERRREGYAPGVALAQRDGGELLLADRRMVGRVDVDGEDAKAVRDRLSHEAIGAAVHVYVCVNLLDALEIGQRVVTSCGAVAGRLGGGGAGSGGSRPHRQDQRNSGAPRVCCHTSRTWTPRWRSCSTASAGAARSVISMCSCSIRAMSEMLR